MSVTAFVQKSTNKILAVHAQEDFVHFVISLLTIPLGKVLFLLNGNSGLGRVDNLYRSVPNLIGGKRINTQDHSINSILNPQLPPKLQQTGIPLSDIEKHVLDVGTEEAVNILKASLSSSYALTNGFQQCLLRQQSKKSEVSKISRALRWR